ncbi:MAG: isoaspartyl peptidase/L-asparaginase [Myxococcota bacterium]
MTLARLIIHGGAGRAMRDPSRRELVREGLREVVAAVFPALQAGARAADIVVEAATRLEDIDTFNAGTGSVLQVDGQVRLSASLMNGETQSFSAVINAQKVRHPIELAKVLQTKRDRVLATRGAEELARMLGVPWYDPVTPRRLREWVEEVEARGDSEMANVVAASNSGTFVAVALDTAGRLAVATSTGGRGFERVDRVSDTATPAGNYAAPEAAISATGIGEHIMDECLAARIVVRVTDGMTLHAALERSIGECARRARVLGVIGIDHTGTIGWAKTSDMLLAAYHDGEQIVDTVDLEPGTMAKTFAAR